MKATLRYILSFAACLMLTLNLPAAEKTAFKTIVIDAGHGGKDPGCVSGKNLEKNINLEIALAFGALIEKNYPEIKVIYTRKTDVFLGLYERSKVAFNNNADLFVSIHVDAVDMRYRKSSPSGHTVYILSTEVPNGKSDLYKHMQEVCQRENSVITLEDDYKVKYKDINVEDPNVSSILSSNQAYVNMLQSLEFASYVNSSLSNGPIKTSRGVQAGRFQVLWNTGVPSVLIETGFITHARDREILSVSANRQEIAKRIFEAFVSYRKEYEKSMSGTQVISEKPQQAEPEQEAQHVQEAPTEQQAKPVQETQPEKPSQQTQPEKPAQPAQQTQKSDTFFGTQIFVLSRKLSDNDPAFKGFKVKVVERNGKFEYFAGCSSTLDEAREKHKKIVQKFPDSYIVKFENGQKTRIK